MSQRIAISSGVLVRVSFLQCKIKRQLLSGTQRGNTGVMRGRKQVRGRRQNKKNWVPVGNLWSDKVCGPKGNDCTLHWARWMSFLVLINNTSSDKPGHAKQVKGPNSNSEEAHYLLNRVPTWAWLLPIQRHFKRFVGNENTRSFCCKKQLWNLGIVFSNTLFMKVLETACMLGFQIFCTRINSFLNSIFPWIFNIFFIWEAERYIELELPWLVPQMPAPNYLSHLLHANVCINRKLLPGAAARHRTRAFHHGMQVS